MTKCCLTFFFLDKNKTRSSLYQKRPKKRIRKTNGSIHNNKPVLCFTTLIHTSPTLLNTPVTIHQVSARLQKTNHTCQRSLLISVYFVLLFFLPVMTMAFLFHVVVLSSIFGCSKHLSTAIFIDDALKCYECELCTDSGLYVTCNANDNFCVEAYTTNYLGSHTTTIYSRFCAPQCPESAAIGSKATTIRCCNSDGCNGQVSNVTPSLSVPSYLFILPLFAFLSTSEIRLFRTRSF